MLSRSGRSRARWWSVALLLAGCGAPTALPPAASMLGAWSYDSAPLSGDTPSLNAGLHVDIDVESVAGMQFAGRVTRWFAGDVGIAPDAFGPLTGSVDGAGGVTLRIAWAAPAVPALMITGVLAGDVVTVRESTLGDGPGPFSSGDRFRRTR
jgi:hypothetical protein